MKRFSDFFVTENKSEYRKSWDAFSVFTDIWDDIEKDRRPTTKVLFLDEKKYILGNLSIDDDVLELEDMFRLSKIMKVQKAVSVIFGQNNISKEIIPTDQEEEKARYLHWEARDNGILVMDHLILTDNSMYFSYADNKLLKRLAA